VADEKGDETREISWDLKLPPRALFSRPLAFEIYATVNTE